MSPRRNHGGHLGHVGSEDLLVHGVLVGAERAAVADVAVQQVVHPLRDREEVLPPVEHEPTVLDLGAATVGEQRLQHLSHPAPVRGGADVPDRAVPEHRPGLVGRSRRALRPLGRQDAGEQLEGKRLDVDFLHPDILTHAEGPEAHGSFDGRAPRRRNATTLPLPGSGRWRNCVGTGV